MTVRERAPRLRSNLDVGLEWSCSDIGSQGRATVVLQLSRKVTKWEWSGLRTTSVRSSECVVGSRGNLDVTNPD